MVPALLVLLFAVSAPGTLPRSSLEPLFDGEAAEVLANTLATQYPTRVPGTPEAEDAARWYEETVSSLGIPTTEDTWTEDLPDLGAVTLRNIVSVIAGRSQATIVLVAHRDNAGAERPLADNATGTATLVELARSFAPQEVGPDPQLQHTLVLVSTDGGAYGGAGAERFAADSPLARAAVAAVVIDRPAGSGRPQIAVAGDGGASPARVLVRTALARLQDEVEAKPSLPSLATQVVDLGMPFAGAEQGRLLGHAISAVTLTTNGDLDHAEATDLQSAATARRLEEMGQATEALVDSVDASAGRAFQTPDSLFFGDQAVSGWAVRLTLVLLVVPIVLGVVDLVARARRRRLPLAPALRALRTRVLIWAFGGVLLAVGAAAGVFPTGADLPPPRFTSFVTKPPVGALAALSGFFALAWLVGRRRLVPDRAATGDERLAGLAAALALLCAFAVTLAVAKPYALVFVLPSLYTWPWIPLDRTTWHGIVLFLAGFAGPAFGLVVLARQVGLSLTHGALYTSALATVGYIPLAAVLAAVVWIAAGAQVAAITFGRYAPYAGGVERPPAGVLRRSGRRLLASLSRG